MKCPFKKNVNYKRDESGRIIGKTEKFGECDKEKCPFYAVSYWREKGELLDFESCMRTDK